MKIFYVDFSLFFSSFMLIFAIMDIYSICCSFFGAKTLFFPNKFFVISNLNLKLLPITHNFEKYFNFKKNIVVIYRKNFEFKIRDIYDIAKIVSQATFAVILETSKK